MMANTDVVTVNQTVLVQKNDILKAIKVVPDKIINFERLRFRIDKAVGHSFGTLFQVVKENLVPVDELNLLNDDESKLIPADQSSGTDNRTLKDTHGDSQPIKRDDIIKMREEGCSGEDIMKHLVANSTSFNEKTKFSQSKYLKKKAKKYSSFIRVIKPTGRLMFKMYYNREPNKICYMSVDYASQMLTMTNIKHDSNVMVVETCSGILLGMILERLKTGVGNAVNIHTGETPSNLFGTSLFNFNEDTWNKTLHSFPLHKLDVLKRSLKSQTAFDPLDFDLKLHQIAAQGDKANENAAGEEGADESEIKNGNGASTAKLQSNPNKRKHDGTTNEKKKAERAVRREKRLGHQKAAWDMMQRQEMDALIIACKMHPTPIVTALLPYLGYSRPFAVYSEYQEPLKELFVQLSLAGSAVNLQLTDNFMRYYQVLPERTHPHVTMAGMKGHILTGIHVNPNSASNS